MAVNDAADVLNVSPEYVRKLLNKGALPSLLPQDVAMYKQQQDEVSKAALDALAKQAQELDLD